MGLLDDVLEERQKTHGSFDDNAMCSQFLKMVMRQQRGWDQLTSVEREALDMIALKLSRVLTGGRHADHFVDIAGYAQLVVRSYEK